MTWPDALSLAALVFIVGLMVDTLIYHWRHKV